MRNKIATLVLGLALMLGVVAVASQPAEAGGRGVATGLAVGTILGLGIAGAYAGPPPYGYGPAPAYYGPGCFPGPRQCGHVGRSCWYDRYGEYVCRGGAYRCWRPTVCD